MPRLTPHMQAQLLRFGRLTVASVMAEYLRQGGHLPLTWATLWVLLPGTVETMLRQMAKVEPLPKVSAAPAPAPPPSAPQG